MVAALASILLTFGIVYTLVVESVPFFKQIPLSEFLGSTEWTPMFAYPKYGIWPLLAGTFSTTIVALILAIPLGTCIAIFLSEFVNERLREILKPILELLAAIPTVVYGYFALLVVTPLLQKLIPSLPGFSVLSAGLVMGVMIIPYVSSLAEDALRAVPRELREASYAMGASNLQTSFRVLVPAAFSGLSSAYILGISRALGETMVVAIAAGMQPNFSLNPLEPAATVTAYIVQVSLGDLPHGTIGYQTIYVAGLSLFLLTLTFNVLGFILRQKYRQAYS
jgi:phosphate transport system permease protein